ncbi:MAG: hypothetical protein PHE27_09160 [Alphaproteobacteria bacterium]|nr:hypothetical protein [Alphaproteobacteria bacterium]
MSRRKLQLGVQYCQITDTTDANAVDKIHGAVIKRMSKLNMVPNFSLAPAYSSIAAGTMVSERVMNSERPKKLIVAVNYAPPDCDEGTHDNARNDFFCARLVGGSYVCGTCNGFEFSYIKPLIVDFFQLVSTNKFKTEFRSLRVLPKHAIKFADDRARQKLIEKGHLRPVKDFNAFIPDVPDVTHVFEVDNFGNVKLYLSETDKIVLGQAVCKSEPIYFSFGKAALEIGGSVKDIEFGPTYEARASETLFAAPVGTNVLGWRSSSTLAMGLNVPVIATIRHKPGETRPAYDADLPRVGAPVLLTTIKPVLAPI